MTSYILLLLALGQSADPRASLLARDSSLSNLSARSGLALALASVWANDALLLYAGAPVISGADVAKSFLGRQPVLDSLTVKWHAMESWISKDGAFGVTTGKSELTGKGGGPSRAGSYIAAWRKEGTEWKIAGLMISGIALPTATVLPAGIGGDWPPLAATGPAKAMIQADIDFAKDGATRGAAPAFRAFAAPNAVLVGGPEPRRGPEAIGAALESGPQSNWEWAPVAARIAGSGDLGFTIGQSTITPKAGGEPSRGKYLTVWAKLPDGSIRYLTDGGNARPVGAKR